MTRRLGQLLVGLVLYAASIAMVVHAGLGSMPWDVLTQGIVKHTGLSFGMVTFLTGLVVLACWIPLRQRPGVGTVANVAVISLLVDPFLAVLGRLPDPLPLGVARRAGRRRASCSTASRPVCTSARASVRVRATGS